jgi:hypothetical protein
MKIGSKCYFPIFSGIKTEFSSIETLIYRGNYNQIVLSIKEHNSSRHDQPLENHVSWKNRPSPPNELHNNSPKFA